MPRTKTGRDRSAGIDGSGFWRLYRIQLQIASGSYPNCVSLARQLEVHQRTVERDIARLRDIFDLPIAYDRQHNGYYFTREFFFPPVRLKEGEAVVLFLGQKILSQCRGLPFEEEVRQALEKVGLLLTDDATVSSRVVEQTISFHIDPIRGREEQVGRDFAVLENAIQHHRVVFMRYYSLARDQITERKVDPYHLRFSDGVWYLIGFCHRRRDYRTFALDRILELSATDEGFEPDPRFSVEDYLAHSLFIERGQTQTVALRFDEDQARYVRGREWHPSQQIEELPSGGLILRLEIGGLGEVKRWLLTFGSHVEVLEPPALRLEMVREIEKMTEIYRKK